MRRIVTVAILCGLLVAAEVQGAGERQPANLLILPFNNATAESNYVVLERGIPDLLSAMLSSYTERVRVVEREKLDAIVREQSLSWQQYVERQSLKHVGKLSRAEYVLRGSFTKSNRKLQVQALLYETETTRLVTSAEATGEPDELIGLCRKLADGIAGFFSTAGSKATAVPVDSDPEKTTLMISGLGYFYSAQFHKALPAFMKVLAKHPDHAEARYWLGRSFYEAGLPDHATVELKMFLRSSPHHPKAGEAKELLAAITRRVHQ